MRFRLINVNTWIINRVKEPTNALAESAPCSLEVKNIWFLCPMMLDSKVPSLGDA